VRRPGPVTVSLHAEIDRGCLRSILPTVDIDSEVVTQDESYY
jgi:hypothetical protein